MNAPMEFPAGSMLTVVRGGKRDAFGDGDADSEHKIGPCAQARASGKKDEVGDKRSVTTISVQAPTGSDIRDGDRVRLPDGRTVALASEVDTPRNPWTGWSPFTTFTLKEVK
ncbi:hypothetical protein [Prescottella equi]|uniref:hypothetical protein n=1 Tax=Rhodococcus hoagii TaxID=43767 RepID=UPI000D0FC789|nr:hypothetical protein [Prescottella equi]AVP71359.1 hypothetical protein C7H75_25080 [Prescottella equi]